MWTLDPIDGTKGFIRGEQYAVCLALVVDSEVQVGVIGCPNLPCDWGEGGGDVGRKGVVFVAVRGQGAEQVWFEIHIHTHTLSLCRPSVPQFGLRAGEHLLFISVYREHGPPERMLLRYESPRRFLADCSSRTNQDIRRMASATKYPRSLVSSFQPFIHSSSGIEKKAGKNNRDHSGVAAPRLASEIWCVGERRRNGVF